MRTAASTKEGAAPYAARFNVLVLNGRHPSTPGGSRASAVETSSSAFHDPYPRTKDDRGRPRGRPMNENITSLIFGHEISPHV